MGSVCESIWRKIIGKPYAGKLHVRFDEGELEIEPYGYYASSLLYCHKYPLRGHRSVSLIKKYTLRSLPQDSSEQMGVAPNELGYRGKVDFS